MTLGDVIKQYRFNHSLSMDAFSERSGLSKAYISLLEKNKHPKTGKSISPSIDCIKQAAHGMNMSFDDLFSILDGKVIVNSSDSKSLKSQVPSNSVRINVLGRVAAGLPIEAVENIIDTEEISEHLASTGEYFGLQIHGDSMEPRMYEGDVVIVRQQDDAESGDIVIAMINGNDATCKRLTKYAGGIMLSSLNSKYEPMMFSNDDILNKPVKILGKVVELRGKL